MAIEAPGGSQDAVGGRGADGDDVVVEHHERQTAIALERVRVAVVDDRLPLPRLDPVVARELAVVLPMLSHVTPNGAVGLRLAIRATTPRDMPTLVPVADVVLTRSWAVTDLGGLAAEHVIAAVADEQTHLLLPIGPRRAVLCELDAHCTIAATMTLPSSHVWGDRAGVRPTRRWSTACRSCPSRSPSIAGASC
ncbi:hypothetical protein [Nannocystis pusilla]|uniref:hypothetical protein n=1 Tax=Nannocystis pusilla TaxID=889268 RepID=UPI003B8270DC